MRRIEMSDLERKALAKAGADCVKLSNEDEQMISMDKQYRTRDGREVRIYAVDAGPRQPIHGAHLTKGVWQQHSWEPDGTDYYGDSPLNLIEVKPRIQREYWVNVPNHGIECTELFITKTACDSVRKRRDPDRYIACVKITIDCEEGEGL